MSETTPRRGGIASAGPIGVRVLGRDLAQLFERVLPILALVVGAALVFVAVAHVADRAFVNHQAGSRMGLAQYAHQGVLYPPLFDDGFYGGTRMMPIPILLHAGLASLTGEFLASGKVLTYLSFLALLIVAFAAMRSLGCSAARSAVLLAAVAASGVGIATSLTISYDALPVALQLAALMLIARARSRAAIVVAGLVCAMALLAKLSALWAAGAIVVWLLLRNRRALGPFLGVYVVTSGLGFFLVQVASDGRFTENILAFSSSAVGDDSTLRVISELARVAVIAPAFYGLLPLAVIEQVLAKRGKDLTVYHLAFVFAAVTLAPVLTRSGAVSNHFLDLLVLSAVLTARLWTRSVGLDSRAAVVPVAVMLGMAASFPSLGAAAVEAASGSDRLQGDVRFLDALVDSDDRVLAEDPSISIAYGQVPVVLDAFLLPTIGARHPEWLEALVDRLERGEFDRVILVQPLDGAPKGWYTVAQFGAKVASAIGRNYSLLDWREGYYVYVPRLA